MAKAVIDLTIPKTEKKSFLKKLLTGAKKEAEKTTIFAGKKSSVPLAIKGAAAATALAAVLNPALSAKVAKTAIKTASKAVPKTPLGAVKAVAGAGVLAGLGVSGTKSLASKVFEKSKTGGELLSGKKDISDVIGTKDSGITGKDILAAAGAAGVIGAGAAVVKGIRDRKKQKEASSPLMVSDPLVSGGISPAPIQEKEEPTASSPASSMPMIVNVIQNQIVR